MSDDFKPFTIQSRTFGSGTDFVDLATVAKDVRSYDDGRAVPASGFEYHIVEQTVNGVDVPYNDVHLSVPGTCLWSKAFRGINRVALDNVIANQVKVDSGGNVITAGVATGTVDFGQGNTTGGASFVTKHNVAGLLQWVLRLPGTSTGGLAIDSQNNIFVAGNFSGVVSFGGANLDSANGSVFLAKFDTNKNFIWSVNFSVGGTCQCASTDSANAAIVVGYNGANSFVAKYSSSGSSVFVNSYTSTVRVTLTAVGTDSNQNIILGGYFTGTTNFGGPGNAITSVGDTTNILLVQLNASATSQNWAKHFGDSGAYHGQTLSCLSVGTDNNISIGGSNSGTVNFGGGNLTNTQAASIVLASFTSQGNHIWSHQFGDNSPYACNPYGIVKDTAGNTIAIGIAQSAINFGGPWLFGGSYDVWIAKFDPLGNYLFAQRYGGAYLDYGYAIAADSQGNMVAAGTFFYSINFGCGSMDAQNDVNGNSFVATLSG